MIPVFLLSFCGFFTEKYKEAIAKKYEKRIFRLPERAYVNTLLGLQPWQRSGLES